MPILQHKVNVSHGSPKSADSTVLMQGELLLYHLSFRKLSPMRADMRDI
jgi:hypothetical protein